MSSIEWYSQLKGCWTLRWDELKYPSYWHNVEKVLFRTKRHANNKIQIQVPNEPELGILFYVPSGGGVYQVGFPNTPETLNMLEEIISYARSVQKEFPEESRVKNIRNLKRDGYLPKD